MATTQQRIKAILEAAFDARTLPFAQRNLIIGSAAKAAGFDLYHSGHGNHCNVTHFELWQGRRPVACFS